MKNIDLSNENYAVAQIKKKFMKEAGFCDKNVFLNEKSAQKPKNLQQLDQLNPGQFSLKWLNASMAIPYNYEYLT